MYKAFLNLVAIICFIVAIVYLLPAARVDIGASIQSLVPQAISQLETNLSSPRPVPTLFATPTYPYPYPWPTENPGATPSTSPTPPATPSPVTPAPTAVPPGAVPPVTAIITSAPPAQTGVYVNTTMGPAGNVSANVSATPAATPSGNVTEQVGGGNPMAVVAIVVLAVVLLAVAAWDIWRSRKK